MTYRAPIKIISLALTLSIVSATPAIANDFSKSDVRGETYCYPVKQAKKIITQQAKLEPKMRDVVDVKIAPRFLIYDDGALPDRYFIRSDETSIDLTITPDGRVPNFIEAVSNSPSGVDLCIQDKARAGLKSDDESLYFEMGLTPFFNNRTGQHSFDELYEGTRDGKSHYRMMVPAAVRAFMPEPNYYHVKYTDINTEPQIFAQTEMGLKPITSEYYNEGYVISLDQLKAHDASALVIKGGAYKLAPVPSIKTMKRFGVGKPRGPKADAKLAKATP